MSVLYILWDITVQGPSGDVVLRFSNRRYVIESGPDTGESYRASWTQASFKRLQIEQMGYRLNSDHVTTVGEIVRRGLSPIEVVNATPGIGQERELDFLFEPDHILKGSVVGQLAVADNETFSGPGLADFETFFTGVLDKKTTRKQETVVFYPEPTTQETKGPLLTVRFNGQSRYFEISGSDAVSIFPLPSFGDFTLQLYMDFTATATGSLFRLFSVALQVMFEIFYNNTTDTIEIGVNDKADTYVILTSAQQVFFRLRFFTVSWDETAGEFSAWVDDVQTVMGQTIDNDLVGVKGTMIVGDPLLDSSSMSSVRTWSVPSTNAQVLDRLESIDHTEEPDLIQAYEFDEARGVTVFDHSVNELHMDISSSVALNGVFKSSRDGEVFMEGKIKPAAFGTVWSAPLLVSDTRLDRAYVAVAAFDVLQVYSQGTLLVASSSNITAGTFTFLAPSRLISAAPPQFFGFRFVVNQRFEIVGSASGDFDGVFTVEDKLTDNLRRVVPIGLDFRTTLQVVEPLATTSTETATIRPLAGSTDWQLDPGEEQRSSEYYPEPNIDNLFVQFVNAPVTPLFADIIGDRNILATGAAGGVFNPPGFIDNVITQLFRTYGPKWDTSTFPPPVYASLDHRVGMYVDDSRSTQQVVNDLTRGTLIWVLEDGLGVISLREFAFPEDLSSPQTLNQKSVISVDRPHFKLHGVSELEALNVHYAKSWTVMDRTAIPAAVDPATRDFITSEFRVVVAGDKDSVTTETPVFVTFENRKKQARDSGNTVLRLSQGVVDAITIREDAKSQLTSFGIGTLVEGVLPRYGLPSLLGVVLGSQQRPTKEEMVLYVWSE